VASVKDATSNISAGFTKTLSDELTCTFTAGTPHHYSLQFLGNWKDRFKEETGLSSV
jgi:hypothetical protein